MKLLLPMLAICVVLALANAESEEFSEKAPAPYGPEAVEERACGNYKDKCGSYGNWRECCSKWRCSCYNVEVFKKTCDCGYKIKNLKPLMDDKDME
uniref:U34-Deinotoxin-Dsu1ak_1 n=1 Tax=Deinopis subrufa TaxID=1905329 RepID=A0A4Q8K8E2_DEISU